MSKENQCPFKLRDEVHTSNGRCLKQAQTCAKMQAHATFYIFSSPEHEVLKVSCCEHPVSLLHALSFVNIYLVHPLEAIVLFQPPWNFTRMFVFVISRSSSYMGHVRSKTRSLGQISLKPCSPSRGHSFASIFMKLHRTVCLDNILVVWIWVMKLYQYVCLDDISVRFQYGSCWVKN